jgi:hypothetical protein
MKVMAKIRTGKSAKLRLPNIVEWIRHSSFIMQVKRLAMVILPDKREEEIVKVLVILFESRNGSGMEEFSLVQDREP